MTVKLLILFAFAAYTGADDPFTGKGVSGGGRACNSGLRIYPYTLNYDNSYSDCPNTPYTVIQQTPGIHYVYRLTPKSRKCPFHILVVQKSTEMPDGWQVTAYTTNIAWRKQDTNAMVDCLMY